MFLLFLLSWNHPYDVRKSSTSSSPVNIYIYFPFPSFSSSRPSPRHVLFQVNPRPDNRRNSKNYLTLSRILVCTSSPPHFRQHKCQEWGNEASGKTLRPFHRDRCAPRLAQK